MALNARYFFDYVEIANDYRVRLYLTPPGAVELPLSTYPAPPFGGNTVSGWVSLSTESISVVNIGDVAFASSFPVGAPRTPIAKIRFQLTAIGDGLRSVLLSPAEPGTVSYSVPGGSSHTMTTDTTPMLTILADNGDATLDIEDFEIAFQGAQIKQVQRPLGLSYESDTSDYEVTFAHIIEACLERIKPVDIAQYALYNFNTSTYANPAGGSGDYAFAHLYDGVWQGGNDNATFAIGSATRAAEIGHQFRCRLFAVETLPRTVELLAQEIYKAFVRDTSATLEFRRATGTNSSVAEGTPFDFLRFSTQTHDGSGDRGITELVINGGGAKQLFFIAAGWQGGDVTYAIDSDELGLALDDTDPNNGVGIVFGMFSPNDTDSGIYSYTNAYDLFVDMAAGGLSKATYQFDDEKSVDVYFSPILGGHRAIRNIYRENAIREDPNAVLGAGYVSEVEAQWADPQGEDEGVIIRAKTEGNLGDARGGVNLFFHNLPYRGSEGDFKWWPGNLPGQPNIADEENSVFLSYPYFSPRRLYYFSDADTLLDGSSPILVHDQVRLEKNWSALTSWTGTSQNRPTPDLRGSVSLPFSQTYQEYYTEQLVRGYRARMLTLQRESCIAYFASDFLQRMFGSEDQWGITVKVDMDKANVAYVGERFQLTDDNDNPASLDIFLQNGSFLDATHYPGIAYCVSAVEDAGFIRLSLLGIAAT